MDTMHVALLGVMVVGILVLAANSLVARAGIIAVSMNTYMQMAVSVIVLAAALYVILSASYEDSYAKWAFTAVGTIMGFWLRGR